MGHQLRRRLWSLGCGVRLTRLARELFAVDGTVLPARARPAGLVLSIRHLGSMRTERFRRPFGLAEGRGRASGNDERERIRRHEGRRMRVPASTTAPP